MVTSEPRHPEPLDPASPAPRVVVVGQGYVGLPLAIRAAEVGYSVVGYDTDKEKIDRLAEGRSYVEDVASARVANARQAGTYLPTTDPHDVAEFDIAVISVPTPLREGQPDLTFVEAAGSLLGRHLTSGATVILESTTWPGTTEEFLRPLLESGSGLEAGRDFLLGYSPERIDPGNPTWNLENTPKIVSGIDAASCQSLEQFYGRLVEQTVPVASPKVAELTKLIENLFRHVNIALANELAMLANELDIDIWATLDAAETKPFGFTRFNPGPGVGGHCLPIDPSYLSWRVKQSLGRPFRFVELANDINDHMPDYVVQRLLLLFNADGLSLRGRRILVLGLAYKRNTGDARESPSRPICEKLVALGAVVRAVDPHIRAEQVPAGVDTAELTAEELEAAEAVVVLVDHDRFDPDLVRRHSRRILDTRNWLGPGEQIDRL